MFSIPLGLLIPNEIILLCFFLFSYSFLKNFLTVPIPTKNNRLAIQLLIPTGAGKSSKF